MSNYDRKPVTIEGLVVFVNPRGTGVRVRGVEFWINRPSMDFYDKPTPKRGQLWRFICDQYESPDRGLVTFIRDEEYLGEAEVEQMQLPQSQQVTDDDRPPFEDSEWYWMIKDARGEVIRETYDQYMQSDAWKRRSKAARAEYGNRCQANLPGCTIIATQVHHAYGYRYLGCEPLWELKAVCDNCHTLLTSMDRKRPVA